MLLPRVVHRIWIGGPEPDWIAEFADSWRRPGWDLVQWDDQAVESLFPLRNQDIFARAAAIAPKHVGQLRSDVLRLEILAHFGGVYVDADFECLRPLDELLGGVQCFAAWEDQDRWVNNAILGATPGHPFIERLIDGLPVSVARNRGYKPNRISGPQYVTRMYRAGATGVTVFPQRLFYPYGWNELERGQEDFPDAYAIHHWQNKRRERGVPAPARRA